MNTKLVQPSEETMQEAAELLLAGQLVALPTETVYGLAANALNSEAVAKIFKAKGRPQDNPLIAHISSMEMLPLVAGVVPEEAVKLAKVFWPGPLTLVLPKSEKVAKEVTAGLDSVGVRMPNHPVALAVIAKAGVPLAAPSANLSGKPSPTTARHVYQDLDTKIPMILDGGQSQVGLESTVLSLVSEPVVLRPGFITAEQIEKVLGRPVALAETKELSPDQTPASPGMKYRHYAPKAEITILRSNYRDFVTYVNQHKAKGVYALCFEQEGAGLQVPFLPYGCKEDSLSQANALFAALRELDEQGAEIVFARCPDGNGVGLAVFNRLLRAASFRVVDI